jgi:hypothetical protein
LQIPGRCAKSHPRGIERESVGPSELVGPKPQV